MKILILILYFCFLCNGDDPPKKQKEKKTKDTLVIHHQIQRSINLKRLDQLNREFDSLNLKQDTLIKKK
jgi:hypothetical protein